MKKKLTGNKVIFILQCNNKTCITTKLSLLRLFSYVSQMRLLFLFVTAPPYHQRFTKLRFHESFAVNSQHAILGTSLGKNSRF